MKLSIKRIIAIALILASGAASANASIAAMAAASAAMAAANAARAANMAAEQQRKEEAAKRQRAAVPLNNLPGCSGPTVSDSYEKNAFSDPCRGNAADGM